MQCSLQGPFQESTQALMQKAGYIFHCTEDGRPCYHRQLNDPLFPRFHAYVVKKNDCLVIDLHFDALDTIDRSGNHDQAWAYSGGRVQQELKVIVEKINEEPKSMINGLHRLTKPKPQPKQNKNLFDVLFR